MNLLPSNPLPTLLNFVACLLIAVLIAVFIISIARILGG